MNTTKNFTKDDLAQGLVENERVNISKSQALNAIDDITASVENALLNGQTIVLRGFGTLKVVERKAKVARNIKAGTMVTIPAHKTVKFTPSKQLKDIFNHDKK